jgi:hypothetical protein
MRGGIKLGHWIGSRENSPKTAISSAFSTGFGREKAAFYWAFFMG